MKNKSIVYMLLAMLCVSNLTACTLPYKIKKLISDTWSAEMNLRETFTGTIEDHDIEDMLDLNDAKFNIAISFYTDGTCETKADTEALEEWVSTVKAYSKTELKENFEESLKASVLDNTITMDTFLEYEGVTSEEEYIEKQLGKTLDEYVEEELGTYLDSIYESALSLEKKGTFEYKQGKINIIFEDGTEQTAYYKKEADVLSFAGPDDNELIMKRSK